jgi:thiol-disulfide isomerase/thioredoxin
VPSQPQPVPRAAAIPVDVQGIRRIDAAGLRQLVQAHGRGTVVNVWASWCGSCREEIPMLLKLREAFQPEGVDFVFVSADEPDAWASAVKLMQDWGAPSPTFAVAGSMGSFKQAMSSSWRGALPATFLFDTTFKLRHFWEGPIYEHEIAPIVQGFLAGDAIDGETRPPLRGGAGP